jgi:hypothetical protein
MALIDLRLEYNRNIKSPTSTKNYIKSSVKKYIIEKIQITKNLKVNINNLKVNIDNFANIIDSIKGQVLWNTNNVYISKTVVFIQRGLKSNVEKDVIRNEITPFNFKLWEQYNIKKL